MQDQNNQDVLHLLLGKMNATRQPYVLTTQLHEQKDKKLIPFLLGSAVTDNHRMDAYKNLTKRGIIREEIYRKDENMGRKITVNNEVVHDLLREERKEWEKIESRKNNRKLDLLTTAVFFLIFGVLAYLAIPASNAEVWNFQNEFLKVEHANGVSLPMVQMTNILQSVTTYYFTTIFLPFGAVTLFLLSIFVFGFSLGSGKRDKLLRHLSKKYYEQSVYEHFYFQKIDRETAAQVVRRMFFTFIAMIAVLLVSAAVNQFDIFHISSITIILCGLLVIQFLYFKSEYLAIVKVKSKAYLELKMGKPGMTELGLLGIQVCLLSFCVYLFLNYFSFLTEKMDEYATHYYENQIKRQQLLLSDKLDNQQTNYIKETIERVDNPLWKLTYSMAINGDAQLWSVRFDWGTEFEEESRRILIAMMVIVLIFVAMGIIKLYLRKRVLARWKVETELKI